MNTARYQKYSGWYSQLQEQEKSRLDNVCNNILSMVPQCLEDLNGGTNIRRRADMPESLQDFYKKELKRAVDQAMTLPLSDTKELDILLGFIFYEIESGETDIIEVHPIPGRNLDHPKKTLHPDSYKWLKSTVEVLSYLLYAVQIKALICEGIFEGTRRESKPPKESRNEILYLLTRQVIQSAGNMDECLSGKGLIEDLFTFDGKHTPEQRNTYRQWLIGKRFIENISAFDFEYLFSVKEIYEGMPTMIFLKPPGHAKRLLMILIDDFKSMRESKIIRANKCITIKSGVVIDSNTHAADPRIFKHMLK